MYTKFLSQVKKQPLKPDYSTVTELPGNKVSQEQLARFYHRYHFASLFCKNKDVLEVACGAGIGLAYLAKAAKRAVGCDIEENVLGHAFHTCKSKENVEIKRADAHTLPFEARTFDVVVLYEAIYYLAEPEKFIDEAKRVLKDNGVLIVCTANKNWADFNPSPYSHQYFSAPELYDRLSEKFSNVTLYGAFPTYTGLVKDKAISLIKAVAIALHLMPKTMKGKECLKRIFFGKLAPLPAELQDGLVQYEEPHRISQSYPSGQYKVLYAVAST
jgi:ubiquinone/menaquinone biosynthesis C-methylase UbiE